MQTLVQDQTQKRSKQLSRYNDRLTVDACGLGDHAVTMLTVQDTLLMATFIAGHDDAEAGHTVLYHSTVLCTVLWCTDHICTVCEANYS